LRPPSPSPLLPDWRLRLPTRALAGREVRATASIFPRGSTSARSLRFRSESRLTRKPVKNKNRPRASRRRRLPIRARLLGQVRDQDERRLSAIPGHWSDGTVFCDHTPARRLQNTWPTCRCRRVTRDAEIDAIAQFIAANGATRCPAAYVAPTATDLSHTEEASRISRLKLKAPMTKLEWFRAVYNTARYAE
jgi:hypothetical protein